MNYERSKRTPAEQAAADRADRREFWIIAVVFSLAIIALTGIYVVVSDVLEPPSPTTGAAEQVDQPALPIPDGGHEPTDPGDRGGSEQLLLMGGLFVALGLGAAWVVHSSRRAKRRLAAGTVDSDGADTHPAVAEPSAPTGTVDTAAPEITASAGSPEPR
jgi:hypothetical protein